MKYTINTSQTAQINMETLTVQKKFLLALFLKLFIIRIARVLKI